MSGLELWAMWLGGESGDAALVLKGATSGMRGDEDSWRLMAILEPWLESDNLFRSPRGSSPTALCWRMRRLLRAMMRVAAFPRVWMTLVDYGGSEKTDWMRGSLSNE